MGAVVLAHGAGAGFRHKNMEAIAQALADQNVASMRFNFPFMQAGKRRVDRPDVAMAAIAAGYEYAVQEWSGPLFAGGHSFGGRMTSLAVAEGLLSPAGLIFCSFPLHQPGKPNLKRAQHLPLIEAPMLFLSGTRDALANQSHLSDVVSRLGNAQLHWLETGNHAYVVLKRTRTNPIDIFTEMGQAVRTFVDGCRY